MSYSNDNRTPPADVAFRPAGIGQGMTWLCGGCNTRRGSTLGSKGAGLKKRCSVCVAANQARAAG